MIKRAFFLLFSVWFLLTACAKPNQYDGLKSLSADTPKTANIKEKPTLGIAFGGGGVRGFMHLGVIKALEEHHIKADLVTGSSAGSIAAVLYASGLSYPQMMQRIDELSEWTLADFVFSKRGVINGQALAKWINNSIRQTDLSAMTIPIGVTVTDMSQRQSLLLVEGNPGQAVQASSSIPGAFIPVQNGERLLVDGGVLNVVPINYAKTMGADIVIGVDIYCHNQPAVEESVGKMLLGTVRMLSCQLAESEMQSADVLITPNFEPEKMGSFESKTQAIAVGYQSTLAVIPQIKALLASSK